MKRVAQLLLVLPVALFAVHCSLLVGYNGFVGDGDADTGATTEVDSGAPPVDSGVDSRPPDAPDTAPRDADSLNTPPVFADAAGPKVQTFCDESIATFCEDFDGKTLVLNEWSEPSGQFLRQVSYLAKSPQNCLLLKVPVIVGGGTFVSATSRTFNTPYANIDLGFAFRPVVVNPSSAPLQFIGIDFARGDVKYGVRLTYSNNQVRLTQHYYGARTDIIGSGFKTFPVGIYSNIKLELASLNTPSPTANLLIDGTQAFARVALTVPVGVDLAPTLSVGAIQGTNPQNGWELRFDNVTLNLRN